jgi:hypothetical protein
MDELRPMVQPQGGLALRILKWFSNTEVIVLQNLDGKKLYDSPDKELKEILGSCCVLVGIDNVVHDAYKPVILSFIKKYYGTFTQRQLIQAFELVATGELGAELQVHYNIMSPLYLSKVLRAYLQKLNGLKSRVERKKQIEEPSKSSPEAYYSRLIKVIEGYKIIPFVWAWDDVHEHLCKSHGKQFTKATTPEEKKAVVLQYLKAKYPEAMQQTIGK